jgi:hypothetical protein
MESTGRSVFTSYKSTVSYKMNYLRNRVEVRISPPLRNVCEVHSRQMFLTVCYVKLYHCFKIRNVILNNSRPDTKFLTEVKGHEYLLTKKLMKH